MGPADTAGPAPGYILHFINRRKFRQEPHHMKKIIIPYLLLAAALTGCSQGNADWKPDQSTTVPKVYTNPVLGSDAAYSQYPNSGAQSNPHADFGYLLQSFGTVPGFRVRFRTTSKTKCHDTKIINARTGHGHPLHRVLFRKRSGGDPGSTPLGRTVGQTGVRFAGSSAQHLDGCDIRPGSIRRTGR